MRYSSFRQMWLEERWGVVGAPAGWKAELPGSGLAHGAGPREEARDRQALECGTVSRAGLKPSPSPVLPGALPVQDSPCVPVEEEISSGQESTSGPVDRRGPASLPAFSGRHVTL